MTIIVPHAREVKPRFFCGARATVGWEITADRSVYWCESCGHFHISTGHACGDVKGSCPEIDEGEKFSILLCGPCPIKILQSIYQKFLNREALRELHQALSVLDALIEAEEVPS